tara:strand:+ start:237 stop:383 length:147 start_codon:yes stop_codon:yes gene_type:complete
MSLLTAVSFPAGEPNFEAVEETSRARSDLLDGRLGFCAALLDASTSVA